MRAGWNHLSAERDKLNSRDMCMYTIFTFYIVHIQINGILTHIFCCIKSLKNKVVIYGLFSQKVQKPSFSNFKFLYFYIKKYNFDRFKVLHVEKRYGSVGSLLTISHQIFKSRVPYTQLVTTLDHSLALLIRQ